LNQPLGAILSNTEAAELFLQSDTPSLEEIRAILGDIRKDDQRASDVIRRMRALLQRHEMESVPLSPAELIEDSIALARPDAVARRVKMESEIAPAVPTVRGDRVQLEQVLLNLLLNGMDALQGCPVEHRRLLVRAQRGADHSVEFAVTDSGPGIAVGKLDRIFESFYSTKPKGMGLGLSISRTIVEAHHGRLWAENNPECGATFRFTLPMAPGQE
jgi:two-component system sensor kinase FixL